MRNAIILVAVLFLFAGTAFSRDITVQELHERLANGEDVFLVDVREPNEHQEFNLGGKLIPLINFSRAIPELEDRKNDEIIIYDRSGNRAGMAQITLAGQGFTNVRVLVGGLLAWIEAYGKTLPTPSPMAVAPPVKPPPVVPAAVPEKFLFKKGAADLIAEATGWLPDLIDDEDIATAITEKWALHKDLVGKTRTQILALLLEDAKSVITDKDTLDAFVQGWNANAAPGQKPNN